jgi:hypothetical protein
MAEQRALLCKGCGAPLPETDDLLRQVTCRFCRVVNERAEPSGPLSHVEIRVDPRPPTHGGASKAAHPALVAESDQVAFWLGPGRIDSLTWP